MAVTPGYFFLLLFIPSVCTIKSPPGEDYYHAAVVEYSPINGRTPRDSLIKNAEKYTEIIAKASEQADIVVFPENGLFYFDRDDFIEVPFGNQITTPASVHPVLQMLSQAARNNSIYVVVNLHEKYRSVSETLHYNTNIVLDRNGNIIARYRKTNLFNEPLNITRTPEHVYFDSDFGVRFGTFICFDILFKEPTLTLIEKYNVTDILYPTIWYSALPFLTAVQTQAAWAYATDTNLLAAGGNSILNSNTGSGIYAGKKGPVIYLQSQRKETSILYGKVIKKGKSGTPTGEIFTVSKERREKLRLWQDPVLKEISTSVISLDIKNASGFEGVPAGEIFPHFRKEQLWGDSVLKGMKSSLIDPEDKISSAKNIEARSSNGTLNAVIESSSYICQDEFCCSLLFNVTHTFKATNNSSKTNAANPYYYRFAVFNGTQFYNSRKVGVQFCALISCLDKSLESCGKPLGGSNSEVNPQQSYHTLDVPNSYLGSTDFHSVTIRTSSLLNDNSFTFPDILEFSEDPDVYGSLMDASRFSFDNGNTMAELNFSSDKLVTAAIYNRVFSWDDPLPVPPL